MATVATKVATHEPPKGRWVGGDPRLAPLLREKVLCPDLNEVSEQVGDVLIHHVVVLACEPLHPLIRFRIESVKTGVPSMSVGEVGVSEQQVRLRHQLALSLGTDPRGELREPGREVAGGVREELVEPTVVYVSIGVLQEEAGFAVVARLPVERLDQVRSRVEQSSQPQVRASDELLTGKATVGIGLPPAVPRAAIQALE